MVQARMYHGEGPIQGSGEGFPSGVESMGENKLRRHRCMFGEIAWIPVLKIDQKFKTFETTETLGKLWSNLDQRESCPGSGMVRLEGRGG